MPHLQLVEAEIKTEGNTYCLSPPQALLNPLDSISQAEETSVVPQNVGLRLSRVTQISPTGATRAAGQQ